jgi:hypothetical protein
MAIDGCSRRGARLPPPQEETTPLARQRAHGGLLRFALVALLRVIDPRPEGRPERCGGPLDARVPRDLGALEAPVPPGLLAAAFGHRRHPRVFWPCGGGRAVAWFAAGDAQPGGDDGTRAWERLGQGAIGVVLGALGAGVRTGLERLPGAPALIDQGLAEQGMGGDHALIGGQGGAVLLAWRRCAITSAERAWWSRKKVARVARRASCAAFRGGPRPNTSQHRRVPWSGNHGSTCGP